jgi:hypothetical protein
MTEDKKNSSDVESQPSHTAHEQEQETAAGEGHERETGETSRKKRWKQGAAIALILTVLCIIAASVSVTTRGSDEGSKQEAYVIGGDVADMGWYSYVVSLQNANRHHFCGGSLIAPDIVLTAAHCKKYFKYRDFFVVIGRQNLATNDGEVIMAIKWDTPLDYNPAFLDNDFAIVVLADRPRYARGYLAKLASEDVPDNMPATVVGWGDTNPSESIQHPSNVLLETQVSILSNEKCKESSDTWGEVEFLGMDFFGEEVSLRDKITDNMLCAKNIGEGNSCKVSRDTLLEY